MTELSKRLERLYEDYNREDAALDPVQIVRRYETPADQEVIGFCAAALAFGRVQSVLNTVNGIARVLGPAPADYVKGFDPKAPHPELRAMVHRWIRGADIVALLWILRQMIDEAGSIEAFFAAGFDPGAEDVGERSTAFRAARWPWICAASTAGGCRSGRGSAISFRGRPRAARASG